MLTKRTYVRPSGIATSAKLIIVGEQPGKQEVFKGQPFIGPSGDVLKECLREAKIVKDTCYITNVIKDLDHPLAFYMEDKKDYYIIMEEGQEYLDILKRELENCTSNTILAVGNVALYALTNRKGIMKWHGSVLDCTLVPGKKVIPCIHPATVIKPKNVYLNKRLIGYDCKRAKVVVDGKWKPKDRTLKIAPTFLESMNFLERLENVDIFDYDIETYNEEISCISFAITTTEAICIPFMGQDGNYFSLEEEVQLWTKIAKLLQNTKAIGGQNLTFDCHFVLRKYGIMVPTTKGKIEDTMIAQGIIMPDYKKGLDFICYIYTDLPYYKADGKLWLGKGGKWEDGWTYNDLDSIVCAEARPQQKKFLEAQGNDYIYRETCDVVGPLVYMMERGFLVDYEGMLQASKDFANQIEDEQKELNTLVGREFNTNSPKQCKDLFYTELGFKPYTKKHKISTDAIALDRLIIKGCKEAELVKSIRGNRKLHSTYVPTNVEQTKLLKVDEDHRIRCSYNPVGTRFSRLSSSESIFGTGMNMQNWPHSLLKYLKFDPYYMGYPMDLAAAENRVVAYVGKVKEMIECFENGEDIHALTAGMILGKDPKDISDEDGSSPIGNGTQSERYWGKKCNHEGDYGIRYRKFALVLGITESQGAFLLNRFHETFPGIQDTYQAGIRQSIVHNRTITTLMGRKIKFLGKKDDDLFRKAYDGMAQGTIGDLINICGLNYIYYNRDLFRYVELMKQVHDEIVFQIPTPYHPTHPVSWEEHVHLLTMIRNSLQTPLVTDYGKEFVIPADISCGITNSKKNPEYKHGRMPSADELDKIYIEQGGLI